MHGPSVPLLNSDRDSAPCSVHTASSGHVRFLSSSFFWRADTVSRGVSSNPVTGILIDCGLEDMALLLMHVFWFHYVDGEIRG